MKIFYNQTLEELYKQGYEPFNKPGLISIGEGEISDLEKSADGLAPILTSSFCFSSDYNPPAWFSNPLEGFVVYAPGAKSRNPPELKKGGIAVIVLPLKKIEK